MVSLTMIFSDDSTRIVREAADHFGVPAIMLACDVGHVFFICYDSLEETFFNNDDLARAKFESIIALLRHFIGAKNFTILDITSIGGIKLRDIEDFGESCTVLHSSFSATR